MERSQTSPAGWTCRATPPALSIYQCPGYIGPGLATTAAVRIDGDIMVGNEGSERMVSRLGRQREGVLRAWHIRADGTPVDCVVDSLLRADRPAE